MSDALAAFRHQAGDTLLHRLDPRAKLLLVASIILFLWLWTNLLVVLFVAVLLGAFVAMGHLGRALAGSVRVYAILGLLLVPLNAFLHSIYTFPPDQASWFLPVLGGLVITGEALAFSLIIYARLVLMLVAASIFFLTTSLDDLEGLFLSLRVPYFFVLTLSLAFRFIPTLAEEAARIREAQVARGLDLDGGGRLRRAWRRTVPLLLPLFVSVLRRSVRLGEALEARATFAYPTRTNTLDLDFRRRDAVVSVAAVVLLSVALLFRFGVAQI